MIELNYRDSRPIYEQIKESYRKLIVSGVLKENERLESVRTLSVQLSINPNTIQRAYNELENEGYIYSIPGKGSFVAPALRQDTGKIDALKEKLRETTAELKFLGVKYDDIVGIVGEEFK